MSYCRFGDNSDVSMFPSDDEAGNEVICCFDCSIMRGPHPWFDSPGDAYAHLLAHRKRGDKVPESALQRLAEEILEGK